MSPALRLLLAFAFATAAFLALWGFGVRGEWYAWVGLGAFCSLLVELRP